MFIKLVLLSLYTRRKKMVDPSYLKGLLKFDKEEYFKKYGIYFNDHDPCWSWSRTW